MRIPDRGTYAERCQLGKEQVAPIIDDAPL